MDCCGDEQHGGKQLEDSTFFTIITTMSRFFWSLLLAFTVFQTSKSYLMNVS